MAVGVFSSEFAPALSSPHVRAAMLAKLTIGGEVWRLHAGAGILVADGVEWNGVTDPVSPRVVEISQVDCPDPAQAAAVTLTLTGVDASFIRAVVTDETDIEGEPAELRLAVFDVSTNAQIGTSIALFAPATMTSPEVKRSGPGVRSVSVTLESRWSIRKFAPGGRTTDADQKRRFPGDTICENAGAYFYERWPS